MRKLCIRGQILSVFKLTGMNQKINPAVHDLSMCDNSRMNNWYFNISQR